MLFTFDRFTTQFGRALESIYMHHKCMGIIFKDKIIECIQPVSIRLTRVVTFGSCFILNELVKLLQIHCQPNECMILLFTELLPLIIN